MQKTFFNQNQKSSTIHTKRYSDHDLRVGKIDKLLITQASLMSQGFMSHQKFKAIKSKLPIITSQHSFNSTQSAFHSHGKVSRMADLLADFDDNIRALKEGLDSIKLQFSTQRAGLHDKLQKTQHSLTNKVGRLGEMVDYSIREAAERTQRLNLNCQSLKDSSAAIAQRLRQLKDKMRNLEHNMGVYTGEDKYLA